MNCHRVQNLLSSYLDQELAAEERRQIRKHLFNCASCSRFYEELTLVKGSLENLEPPSTGEDILKKVHLYQEGELLARTFFWGKRLVLTAIWILLFLVTSLLLFPGSSPPELASEEPASPGRPSQEWEVTQEDDQDDYIEQPVLPFLPGIPVSR